MYPSSDLVIWAAAFDLIKFPSHLTLSKEMVSILVEISSIGGLQSKQLFGSITTAFFSLLLLYKYTGCPTWLQFENSRQGIKSFSFTNLKLLNRQFQIEHKMILFYL